MTQLSHVCVCLRNFKEWNLISYHLSPFGKNDTKREIVIRDTNQRCCKVEVWSDYEKVNKLVTSIFMKL